MRTLAAGVLLALLATPALAIGGDIDGSGVVDSADVRRLRQSLGPGGTPLSGPALVAADVAPLDGPDELVDERDLAVLLRMLRECPVIECNPSAGGPGQGNYCPYDPVIAEPSRPGCLGPRVRFDGTRNNLHQLDGLYSGFWELLTADGYEVLDLADGGPYESFDGITRARFGDVLVLAGVRAGPANKVTPPQVAKIVSWIADGGALLLTTDHFDYNAPVNDLAAALGVVIDIGPSPALTVTGDVVPNPASPIAQGVADVSRNGGAALFSAATLPPDTSHEVVLLLENSQVGPGAALVMAVEHGAGRAVVVSDAALFSAQVYGLSGLIGLAGGLDNERLLLNAMRWLDGSLEGAP